MWVENCSDEVWIGVKGQSNWEIAGSPRNIFRYSLAEWVVVVESQLELWGRKLTGFLLTPNATASLKAGVRLWGISFIVERETAQTIS